MQNTSEIALGGGCHWCTEAVFQSVKGVESVEQGFVSSVDENDNFSEAVIVHFNTDWVKLKTLIEIHLLTHNSTSNHSMRNKYRSAIYTFSELQNIEVLRFVQKFQDELDHQIITQVLPFQSFKPSREEITNYYYKNPKKPFCETFINPKLILLLNKFSTHVNHEKLQHMKFYATPND